MVQKNSSGLLDAKRLQAIADTVRVISAEAVEKAKSGHPGLPLGAADFATVLWSEFLRFDPEDPEWEGRDRLILSAGHGSMLLYSFLHLFQGSLSINDLKKFRQWDSKTPGHPEFGLTPGVETTTGPLGQGFANGVGIALSLKMLEDRYQTDLLSGRVFGVVSDGDLMEGVSAEATSLAGHLKLSNLIYIYDDNNISIGGSTDVCFSESVSDRFQSYGWAVQSIDGHNQQEVREALQNASEESCPSLICAKTTIGFGSPNKQGTAGVHGAPLGEEEVQLLKKTLGKENEEAFFVSEEVQQSCQQILDKKKEEVKAWKKEWKSWKDKNAQLSDLWEAQKTKTIPTNLRTELIEKFQKSEPTATRNISGAIIQDIAATVPFFVGGSADLEPSTKTTIQSSTDIKANDYSGKNIRFGVREHAMGAMVNGFAYTGSWIPFGSTFLVFSDYMRPAIRLAALSHLQSVFIFSHDSIFLGEDGPTHQPVEHLASLRAIPNLHVYRPGTALEVAMSYWRALERTNGPSAIALTRQEIPAIDQVAADAENIERGAYVLREREEASCTLLASGSELSLALAVQEELEKNGMKLRIVSLPCKEDFCLQPMEYRFQVIPPDVPCVFLEAAKVEETFSLHPGPLLRIQLDSFGASAPLSVLAEKFEFTVSKVSSRIVEWKESDFCWPTENLIV